MKIARAATAFVDRLRVDRSGGPLAEFALLLPFLLILIFGAFEFSRVLNIQTMINRSVQDAARYAARQPAAIDPDSCVPGSTEWGDVKTKAVTIVRNGSLAATAPLHPDLATATVDVDITCVPKTGGMISTNAASPSEVPIVVATVVVTVTDIGFFSFLNRAGISLSAEHREIAVGL